MPLPYIVKFVSSESKKGKTTVASKVVSILTSKGYRVSVIKHCSKGLEVEEKDTKKYIESGADIVIASAPGMATVYIRDHVDSLENALAYARTPIIIVEGFKTSKTGETILVVEEQAEIEELARKTSNIIAIVARSRIETRVETPVFLIGDELKLAEFLETRMLEFTIKQSGQLNCQICGYPTCRDFAVAYLKGKTNWCPVVSSVEVKVNGVSIVLNPFVKNIVKHTVIGMLRSLKGVPEQIKEISINIGEN
ncbi:MAG: molybdopterin-guanine dinucleotide biosynthesis protein B [Desulfurococcaceae archaeon]